VLIVSASNGLINPVTELVYYWKDRNVLPGDSDVGLSSVELQPSPFNK